MYDLTDHYIEKLSIPKHQCFPKLITVRVEIFEVFIISRFSWVADATKIIHVEGGITTREIF